MTTICIVRHGQSVWNAKGLIQGRTDVVLSEKGIEEAKRAASFLNSGWDVIVSSPLQRARQTAKIIGEAASINYIDIINDLTERDWGKAAGLTMPQLNEIYPKWDVPGIEAWEDLRIRGKNALEEIVQKYPNRRVIAVSHGALIRAIFDFLTNGQQKQGLGKVGNASVSIIHYNKGQWDIEMLNSIAHLEGLEGATISE